MKKLTEGQKDCLIKGYEKGYIWAMSDSWAGKSYQKNERYIPKLKSMGLITEDTIRKYEFYTLTNEGIDLVKQLITI
jgi:CTP-dependent riboflavin kinase